MNWNRKYIILCCSAFLLLSVFLIVKGQQEKPAEQLKADQTESVSDSAVGNVPSVEDEGQNPERNTDTRKEDTTQHRKKKAEQEEKKKDTDKTDLASKKKQDSKKEEKKAEKKEEKKGKNEGTKSGKKTGNETEKKETQAEQENKPTGTQTPSGVNQTSETATSEDKFKQVSFQIECIRILDRKDLWKKGIEEIVPANGIYYKGTLLIQEKETVYDLLVRVCKEKNIALDSQYTPLYGTYYIKAIGNLYEFDCGEESGWKYSVNGKTPGVGCSNYTVKSGDVIQFYYALTI